MLYLSPQEDRRLYMASAPPINEEEEDGDAISFRGGVSGNFADDVS